SACAKSSAGFANWHVHCFRTSRTVSVDHTGTLLFAN
ncbi:MAG: hypothetical protein ACI9KE_006721, partial [Polyangiales bacterium]